MPSDIHTGKDTASKQKTSGNMEKNKGYKHATSAFSYTNSNYDD